jgi:hypothetical protein
LWYLCCVFFLFPLVIILHPLSSFNFSYHVLLLLSRLASHITSCMNGPSSSPGGLIVDPRGTQGFPRGVGGGDPSTQRGVTGAPKRPVGFHCRSPGGPKGSPYGASLWYLCCVFFSFPRVIILLPLSSFNFAYHVMLLLSRIASLITSCMYGPSSSPGGLIVDPRGNEGFPRGVGGTHQHRGCHILHKVIQLPNQV